MKTGSGPLRLGFAKGRGSRQCFDHLARSGVEVPPEFATGRLPVFASPQHDLQCVQVRGRDLPWLLEQGHLDVAIGSDIWFWEHDAPEPVKVAALDVRPCRFCLLAPAGHEDRPLRWISTRYPATLLREATTLASDVEIVRLEGSHEVALWLGFADAIADMVETGWTRDRLDLKEVEELCSVRFGIWLIDDDPSRLETLRRLLPLADWPASTTLIKGPGAVGF